MEAVNKELSCPLCQALFEDPVILPCEHIMCRNCVLSRLEGVGIYKNECPMCKMPTFRRDLRPDKIVANLVSIARANAEGSGKQQGQGDDYAFEDKGGAVDGVAEEGKADGAEDVAKKAEGGDGTVDKVEVDARALAEKASERELLELLEQVSDSVQAVDASISSRTGCPGTEGPCTDLEHMPTSALQQRYRALFGTCPASMSRRQVVKKLQGVDDEVLTAALTVSQEPSPKRHHHSPKILFSSIGKHDLARRRKGIKCAGVVSGSPLGKAHRQIGALGATVAAKFSPEVSHVVCATADWSNRVANRGVKYMLAVLHGKPVVGMAWLDDSLASGTWQETAGYELKEWNDAIGEEVNAQELARDRRKRGLPGVLDGFRVAPGGPLWLKEVVESAGGEMATRVDSANVAIGRRDVPSGVASVNIRWLLDAVSLQRAPALHEYPCAE